MTFEEFLEDKYPLYKTIDYQEIHISWKTAINLINEYQQSLKTNNDEKTPITSAATDW